ncbi:Hsp20/alpha crystallin family protein [Neobacillus sp. D3-1R]|uniref:Hsp20/alpha crystallin family protein n=1 Tax=Neobacillus sp. D3-1R TaxID=3445778 RepID=UPI003FA09452
MDYDKLKQWMEVAQKYNSGNFWGNIFDTMNPKDTMNDFMGDPIPEGGRTSPTSEFPTTDIFLTNAEVVIFVELPGLDKEDIQLFITGHSIMIKGYRNLPLNPLSTVQSEGVYGEFQRKIPLPEPTEREHIRARFEKGLLILTYPRGPQYEEPIIIE